MKIYIFFVMTLTACCGCGLFQNKSSCYQDSLKNLTEQESYNAACESFDKQVSRIKNRDGFYIYHTEYVKTVIRDDAIFFNHKENKCLVLLLQQTKDDLKLDQIQIVQGTLNLGTWVFSSDRFPPVPDVIFTINKWSLKGKNINNSFKKIANKGRSFVLNAGTFDSRGCEIDEKYWFGN